MKPAKSGHGAVAHTNGKASAGNGAASSVASSEDEEIVRRIVDAPGDQPCSPNVGWQRSGMTRERRWESLGNVGATVWFTGLPGAGKSTIAGVVEERLIGGGHPAFLLDGDNLRHGLNGDLGFDQGARSENVRRAAHVARLFADAGMIALVGLVSPYADDRRAAAAMHAADGLDFIEIFVDTPLEVCERRDPKGLYGRARAGELADLTGVSAPYEAPEQPDLVLGTCQGSVDSEADRVLDLLAGRGLIAIRQAS